MYLVLCLKKKESWVTVSDQQITRHTLQNMLLIATHVHLIRTGTD